MMKRRVFLTVAAAALPAAFLSAEASATQRLEMAARADFFLESLSEEQQAKAKIPFNTEERENWHYIPKSRQGIALKELNDEQKAAAFALLDSGLSESGRKKARLILELEAILAVIENNPEFRDVGAYYFSVFGRPGDADGWGWRFEGHHISINITQKGDRVSAAPAFWGANPAEVRSGELKGVRTLPHEEDVARELAQSLANAGKPVVTESDAPNEFHTRARRRVSALETKGIAFAEMTEAQQKLVQRLLAEHTGNFHPAIAAQEWAALEKNGWETLRFSWAGGLQQGDRHYYLLQGPSFLLEYVNYQNNANHIHTVWRSFDGDYGLDLLS